MIKVKRTPSSLYVNCGPTEELFFCVLNASLPLHFLHAKSSQMGLS